QQRTARRQGVLPSARARRLEQVSGWAWDQDAARWAHSLKLLRDLADELGSLKQRAAVPSIYRGRRDSRGRPLGTWVAAQRQAERDGMLDDDRATVLEEIPGWDWNGGLPAADVAMVQALRLFCEFEHHANVPQTHRENGLELGRWVWAVRRR